MKLYWEQKNICRKHIWEGEKDKRKCEKRQEYNKSLHRDLNDREAGKLESILVLPILFILAHENPNSRVCTLYLPSFLSCKSLQFLPDYPKLFN